MSLARWRYVAGLAASPALAAAAASAAAFLAAAAAAFSASFLAAFTLFVLGSRLRRFGNLGGFGRGGRIGGGFLSGCGGRLLGFLPGGLFFLLNLARPIGRMNRRMVRIGLGQARLVENQRAEALETRQLVIVIHLDGVKRAELGAQAARHADRRVDVELGRLRNGTVGLGIVGANDPDALRRADLGADAARRAAISFFCVSKTRNGM